MSFEMTTQQSNAIELDSIGGILLEAGAGSGKTHVIVDRYLRALKNTDPSRFKNWQPAPVAAITFTEKSAQELRTRIILRIKDLLSSEVSWVKNIEENCLQFIKKPELLNVSTIHGFCSREIWKNRIYLGLGPSLKVLNESDAALLKEEVLRDLLSLRARTIPDFSEFRIREMLTLMDQNQEKLVNLNLDAQSWMRDIKRDRLELFRKKIHSRLDGWLNFCEENHEYLKSGSSAEKFLLGFSSWAKNLIDSPDLPEEPGETLAAFISSFKSVVTARKDSIEKDVGVQLKLIHDRLKHISRIIEIDKNLESLAMEKLFEMIEFFKQYRERYQVRKRSSDLLDFDDLEIVMLEALSDKVFADELSLKFKEILVDEYQDTSEIQFKILNKIKGDTLKGLYFVGDSKQSIYGFRGADLRVYNRTRGACSTILPLDLNFRSTPEVLSFVNSLFTGLLPAEIGEDSLYEARMQPLSSACEGFEKVRLNIFENPKPKKITAEEIMLIEAREIAEKCRELVDSGESPSDICILLRKIKGNDAYFKALESRGLSVKSKTHSARESIFETTFKALLRFAYNQKNSASRSVIQLSSLTSGACEKNSKSDEVWINEFRQRYFTASRELFTTIAFDFLFRNPSFVPSQEDIFFYSKIKSWELAGDSLSAIVEKIERLEKRGLRDKRSSLEVAMNQIQVMTVHGAKGLEFKNVILGGLYQGSRSDVSGLCVEGSRPGLKLDRVYGKSYETFDLRLSRGDKQLIEIAEKKRLLYVALTRAKKRLLIWVHEGKSDEWGRWILDYIAQPNCDFSEYLQIDQKNYST